MRRRSANNPRLATLSLLEAVLDKGFNLPETDTGDRLSSSRDRAFSRHLAYGVLRWLNALEFLAGQLLEKPLKRRDRDIQRLILLGLYQLWKDDRAPHAAINETAEAARQLGKNWAVGLVNAVLRRFQREQEARLAELDASDCRFAHPGWLLERLREDWPGDWQRIAEANNRQAPLWLRLNQHHDRAATLERLAKEGFRTSPHLQVGSAVKIEPAAPVEHLPGFGDGCFSVQDPAAQLAAGLLQAKPGQRVLDACAAPGGKTGHLLEAVPELRMTVVDKSQRRLQRIRENLQRLGFSEHAGLQLRAADATRPDTFWDGEHYDRILLDAPCSATGVIRRHPEIKWLRSEEQVGEAAALQTALLNALWPLLKPGGMLLYATSSILEVENSSPISQFCADRPEALLQPPAQEWGSRREAGTQILPGELEMDGFYYAGIQKTNC
jgi:16S rRNA (cytosine967-C5)-methyltransferase